ncbi:4Fe-4S dicluster domain-containing protein, partial [Aeromonas mytilicola]
MRSHRTSSGPRLREALAPTTPICEMDKRMCDIKDTQPQNIVWTPPQGGSGPNYPNMGSLGSWSIYPSAIPRARRGGWAPARGGPGR